MTHGGLALAVVSSAWLLFACGGDDDDDTAGPDAASADAAAGAADAPTAVTIPDPGGGANAWDAPDTCCGTPGEAHPVGVVTQDGPYVEGDAGATGDVFYVFRTGPAFTSLTIGLFPAGADITAVHVHDGDGLVFGPEITPTTSTATGGTWPLAADHVYVLEVITVGGGFF